MIFTVYAYADSISNATNSYLFTPIIRYLAKKRNIYASFACAPPTVVPIYSYVKSKGIERHSTMIGYYRTGKVVSTFIEANDAHSLELAKKHCLVRANSCGSRIRFVGKPARFNRFIKEIRKCV